MFPSWNLVCWTNFLRTSSQTFHCKFQNYFLELIAEAWAINMQANAVIREREREREIKPVWITASVSLSNSVQQQRLLIVKLICFKNLATEKCHVAFQLLNYFIHKFTGHCWQQVSVRVSPRVRVSVLCVRLWERMGERQRDFHT